MGVIGVVGVVAGAVVATVAVIAGVAVVMVERAIRDFDKGMGMDPETIDALKMGLHDRTSR